LRTISGYVELLARRYQGQLDDDADRFINHTVDGCSRLRTLIDDLLAYSRAGRAEELTASIDCNATVSEVVTRLTAALDAVGGVVEFDGLPEIQGDPTQLTQLFQNLIANSLKFARPNTPPRVRITAARQDGIWTISIDDNGIGIEAEYRERIFGMFQRLHARDAYPGTGIGLAICKRIVEAHGGRIWVEPSADGGSRFCFTSATNAKEAT
jgi:light-regulated signal transduction histidine kinase (bacteriophytochrome)